MDAAGERLAVACLLCMLGASPQACELAGSMEIDPTPLMVRTQTYKILKTPRMRMQPAGCAP